MAKVELTFCEDGPVLMTGDGAYVVDGKTVNPPSAGRVAICRCGASQNKPFCDGAHRAAGFTAEGGTLTVEQ